jgi:hypothetical protein
MTNKIINIAVASGLALMYKNKIAGGKATVVNRQKNPSENLSPSQNAIANIEAIQKKAADYAKSNKIHGQNYDALNSQIANLDSLKIQIDRNNMIVNGCIELERIMPIPGAMVNLADSDINNNDDIQQYQRSAQSSIRTLNDINDNWMKHNAMQLNLIDFDRNIKGLIGLYNDNKLQKEYGFATIQKHKNKLNLIAHQATLDRASYNGCTEARRILLPANKEDYLIDGKIPPSIQNIISFIIKNAEDINEEINNIN